MTGQQLSIDNGKLTRMAEKIEEREKHIINVLISEGATPANGLHKYGHPVDCGITMDALLSLEKRSKVSYNPYSKEWSLKLALCHH